MKDLNDKRFWEKIKPFFSDKGLQTNNIILKDKNRLVTGVSIIANTFNNYLVNITNTLNLKASMPKSKSSSDLLQLYEDYFSVKIKEKDKIQNKFQFKEVSPDEVRKITQSLNEKKSEISSSEAATGGVL